MKDKVLKMALEALELLSQQPTDLALDYADNAITAIKEALAQTQTQKPVAWLEPEWGEKICPEVGYEVTMTDDHPRDLCWIPLYAQRPWVDLTDEEISEIAINNPPMVHEFARAVLAKSKDKNNG